MKKINLGKEIEKDVKKILNLENYLRIMETIMILSLNLLN